MIVLMVVNLYTVRIVLQVLGETDYGIYNVVGGIVTMFSFLNSTLSTSSQRYFSVELAQGNLDKVNKWLCLNVTTFLGISGVVLLLAESIGVWFLNNQMTIPDNRIVSANIVFQISLATFVANMVTVPYNALVIAHEKMSAFAYISIIEAGAKLLVAIALPFIQTDSLILYAFLTMFVIVSIASSYIIYCRRNFSESSFHFYWNKVEATDLIKFSGWHFMGTMSVVLRSQAINILVNIFFNPAVNAARAISYQILSAINQLSANFFTAVKPQIYKSYAANEKQSLYSLIFRSSILCYFLVSIIAFPIISNTEYILSLWLKDVPEYTVVFTQLVIVNGLIDSTNGPTIAAALATGKIARYEIIVSLLITLNLPLSYLLLKMGFNPNYPIIVSIVISILTTLTRAYLLKGMIGISFKRYLIVLVKMTLCGLLMYGFILATLYCKASSILELIFSFGIITILNVVLSYAIILSQGERHQIITFIKNKIGKNNA